MIRVRSYKHIPIALLGVITLSLSVSRCSPIAPSVYKNQLGVSNGAGGTAPGGASPGNAGIQAQGFLYDSRLVDSDGYTKSVEPVPAANRIELSESSLPDLYQAFKTNRTVQIQIDGAPVEAVGYFELGLRSDQFATYDLGKYQSSFSMTGPGKYTLSVPSSVPDSVWSTVRDNLVSITLVFGSAVTESGTHPSTPPASTAKTDSTATTSNPEPAPAPSSSPSPAPSTSPSPSPGSGVTPW